ncbi:MAG TPA: dynamin family protein, partial [Candidatus Limnocylindria bacterium]|nr:dynamin family protein [Candidatus Limnocylindria bacterium]
AHRREDLVRSLDIALARVDRPETVVCVAGEFKQGKSSLINALIGVSACPIDDDLATAAVTVVRYGPELEVLVRRHVGRDAVVDRVELDQLADYVTERGNPGNARGVEVVEIRVPNRLLERGWAFVDTPGIGGLNRAQAAAALGFLPVADALLFVTDSSAELAEHELAFLRRAHEVCPTVLVALSKIDLHGAWRRIEQADRTHLDAIGLSVEPLPVSSVLRAEALRTRDATLNDESGIPRLLEVLHEQVLGGARAGALRRAVADARSAIRQLDVPLQREQAAVRDPSRMGAEQAELRVIRDRLQLLRGPAARWSQRLGDGFSDLGSSVDYQLRGAMRSILRAAEERIDATDPGADWEALTTAVQAQVAEAVGATFDAIATGATALRDELATLVDDTAISASAGLAAGVDVEQLWSRRPIARSTVRASVGMGFGALRGAQSGVVMLGMLGSLFQLAVIGPALLGGAALFAGKSLVDERKRQVSTRRQEARTSLRQYVDDVQFEVGTRVRDMLRELQRALRDDVAGRIDELSRTNTEAAAALERALQQDQATRAARDQELGTELQALADLERRLKRLLLESAT